MNGDVPPTTSKVNGTIISSTIVPAETSNGAAKVNGDVELKTTKNGSTDGGSEKSDETTKKKPAVGVLEIVSGSVVISRIAHQESNEREKN